MSSPALLLGSLSYLSYFLIRCFLELAEVFYETYIEATLTIPASSETTLFNLIITLAVCIFYLWEICLSNFEGKLRADIPLGMFS